MSIGILSSVADGFLRELIRTYMLQHPDIAIEVLEGAWSEHIGLVRKRRLDVAFIMDRDDVEDCEVTPLWNERIFVALPNGHALAARKEVDWQALRNEPFIARLDEGGSSFCERVVKRLSDGNRAPRWRSSMSLARL